MKKKSWVFLSVVVLVLSALSGAMGVGFVGGSGLAFWPRVLCQFVFIVTPILVLQLVVQLMTELFKKEK